MFVRFVKMMVSKNWLITKSEMPNWNPMSSDLINYRSTLGKLVFDGVSKM